MRVVPSAIGATMVAIGGYFAVLWGVEALHVLASPNYGLGDYGRSQVVYGYGRLFALSSDGVIRLAAFFAASKLAAAIAFALYLFQRVCAFPDGKIDREMLEAALIIVVLLSVAMVLPALIENNGNLIRLHGLFLLLAGVAATLNAIESLVTERTEPDIAKFAHRGAPRHRVLLWLWSNARKAAA